MRMLIPRANYEDEIWELKERSAVRAPCAGGEGGLRGRAVPSKE
jgi:hypothetical protein